MTAPEVYGVRVGPGGVIKLMLCSMISDENLTVLTDKRCKDPVGVLLSPRLDQVWVPVRQDLNLPHELSPQSRIHPALQLRWSQLWTIV